MIASFSMTDRVNQKEKNMVRGSVVEALPNALFKVEIEGGNEVLAFLAGKMRIHRIRVLVGDKVEMQIDPYGGKARITKRL